MITPTEPNPRWPETDIPIGIGNRFILLIVYITNNTPPYSLESSIPLPIDRKCLFEKYEGH